MRTISEILTEISTAQHLAYRQGLHDQKNGTQQAEFEKYAKREAKAILLQLGIPINELEEMCEAKKHGRLVVLTEQRMPLVWGDKEHNSVLCPECKEDLMGIPYGERLLLQCPHCGKYIDATLNPTFEAVQAALKEQSK